MARTIKKYTGIAIGRKCNNCGKDIWLNVMEDSDGKFVIESCDCNIDDILARTVKTNVSNVYSIPEYIVHLEKQIAALSDAKKKLKKLI